MASGCDDVDPPIGPGATAAQPAGTLSRDIRPGDASEINALPGLLGLGAEITASQQFVAALPKGRALGRALWDLRAEIVQRYDEQAAQDLFAVLAKPYDRRPAHRPKGATSYADENALLLSRLDAKIAKAGPGTKLAQLINQIAHERVIETGIRGASERRDAEKKIRERLGYQYKEQRKKEANHLRLLANALSSPKPPGVLGFAASTTAPSGGLLGLQKK